MGIPNFIIFGPKIDCGYSLEPVLTCSHDVVSKHIKNIKVFLVKFSIFSAEKNLCIMHGRVFAILNFDKPSIKSLIGSLSLIKHRMEKTAVCISGHPNKIWHAIEEKNERFIST